MFNVSLKRIGELLLIALIFILITLWAVSHSPPSKPQASVQTAQLDPACLPVPQQGIIPGKPYVQPRASPGDEKAKPKRNPYQHPMVAMANTPTELAGYHSLPLPEG